LARHNSRGGQLSIPQSNVDVDGWATVASALALSWLDFDDHAQPETLDELE
jgi:hypothetical protein